MQSIVRGWQYNFTAEYEDQLSRLLLFRLATFF